MACKQQNSQIFKLVPAVAIWCIDSYTTTYLNVLNREKQRKTKENTQKGM